MTMSVQTGRDRARSPGRRRLVERLQSAAVHTVRVVRPRGRSRRGDDELAATRRAKYARFEPFLLREHHEWTSRVDVSTRDEGVGPVVYALPADAAASYAVAETEAVSSNGYDPHALALIEQYRDGIVLDCGAGYRREYLDNVVNLEIVPYRSTDIVAVAEQIPLRDESVDAVICSAVLEHVKRPWLAAAEIRRVLKPGGALYVAVPFLQPLHGYPNHFFNMTGSGLASLFDDFEVEWHEVIDSLHPIWSLTWILASWRQALPEGTRRTFERMRVADLIGDPSSYLGQPFATQLSRESRFELASGTALLARKPS
jgi:SAM-dependent methyltransferase